MTTENTTVETLITETQKMSLNEKTAGRIAYHVAEGEKKAARLLTLKADSKGYLACQASIEKNDALLAKLRSQLATRLAKAEASNDVAAPVSAAAVDAA